MRSFGRKLFHGSLLRIFQFVAAMIIGFFLMPFLIHSLGDHNYGYWVLAGSILGYFGILDLGVVSAVQYHVAEAFGQEDAEHANRVLSTAFYMFAVLGLIILFLTSVTALFSHRFIKDPKDALVFRDVLLITGAGFAIGFPGRTFMGGLAAHLRWDLVSLGNIGQLFLRTLLSVAVIEAGYGIVALALVTVLSDLVTYAYYFVLLGSIQAKFSISLGLANIRTFKEIVNYSAFALISRIADKLRFFLDAVVVSAFVSVSAVTHYSIASKLGFSLSDFVIAAVGVLSPWFSFLFGGSDFAAIRKVLAFGTKASAFVSVTIGCCLLLYGKAFIQAWMGKPYVDAYWPMLFLVIAILVDVSQLPSVSYLFGISRHRFIAYLSLAEGIVNAILSIILVHPFGMSGVALGTLIPLLIAKLLVQPKYVCREAGISIRSYYFGFFGRTLGISIAAMVIPWLLVFEWINRPNLLLIAILVTCQTMIAMLAAYFLIMDKEERAAVRRVIFSSRGVAPLSAVCDLDVTD